VNHYCIHVDHEHHVVYVYDAHEHGGHDLLLAEERRAALDDVARAIARDRATAGVVRPPLR
jgi:ATP-dependent DNA ligase